MPCYKPLQGYRARHVNESGKRSIVFNAKEGFQDRPVEVPCGRCIGCRLERSRQWAIRCVHEASLWPDNAFVTLTYDDSHVPPGGTLVKKDYQDFMKRLRHHFPQKIRYFQCGEYGETTHRPHYHACLFNMDFPDKEFYTERQGVRLYFSPMLQDVWGKGFCTIGDVTFESAAYVARYIMKKVTGDDAEEHYKSLDPETGEIFDIIPEYVTMSRGGRGDGLGGIGKGWFEKWSGDVYPDDTIVMRGKEMKPPRFYDGLFEQKDPEALMAIKHERLVYAKKHAEHNTRERLAVREKVKQAQVGQLKRTI